MSGVLIELSKRTEVKLLRAIVLSNIRPKNKNALCIRSVVTYKYISTRVAIRDRRIYRIEKKFEKVMKRYDRISDFTVTPVDEELAAQQTSIYKSAQKKKS